MTDQELVNDVRSRLSDEDDYFDEDKMRALCDLADRLLKEQSARQAKDDKLVDELRQPLQAILSEADNLRKKPPDASYKAIERCVDRIDATLVKALVRPRVEIGRPSSAEASEKVFGVSDRRSRKIRRLVEEVCSKSKK